MAKLLDFNSIYPLVDDLYGIEPNPSDFESIALAGWELINNKHTRLYRYIGDTKNRELKLPCNVDIIESVHVPFVDAQLTDSTRDFVDLHSVYVEEYIDVWKVFNDPFAQKGKLIKYKEGDNILYFDRDYKNVMVVYHGVLVDDEEGLPKINEKEQKAIAAYVAYITLYKDGIKKRDKNSIELANLIKADWLRACNSARIPEHLSQNDMDKILDAKVRWDRKQYGRSLIPIV